MHQKQFVIEERNQLLVLLYALPSRNESCIAERQGHQRVSLFPTFALPYWVLHPFAVPPPKTRPSRVQRPQGAHRFRPVQISEGSRNVHHVVCSRTTGKGKLERCTHILDIFHELPNQTL